MDILGHPACLSCETTNHSPTQWHSHFQYSAAHLTRMGSWIEFEKLKGSGPSSGWLKYYASGKRVAKRAANGLRIMIVDAKVVPKEVGFDTGYATCCLLEWGISHGCTCHSVVHVLPAKHERMRAFVVFGAPSAASSVQKAGRYVAPRHVG